MKPRSVIAVDIDDVLAANAESFIDYTNKRWGTSLTIDDYDEHWAKVWKVERDVKGEEELVKELYKAQLFREYRHFPEAEPVLRELAKEYKLVIVTSRQRSITRDTTDWVEKYYKGLFNEIHHANIWDNMEKSSSERLKATKAELCRQIGADYLIDDQPKHCVAAAKAGIKALLYGDYAWNKNEDLVRGVVRVKNWQEVLDYFTRPNFQSLNSKKEA